MMKMRWLRIGLVSLALSLGMARQASAAEYYVSPTGSDSNLGTIDSPWATPLNAWTVADTGDTVYFRGGTYAINSEIRTKYVGHDGTADKPIIFKNYQSETVDFTSTLTGTVFKIEKTYNHIQGINFTGAATWFAVGLDSNAAGFKASNCTAKMNYGGDNTGFVYLTSRSAGTIVENCKIVGPGYGAGIHNNTAGIVILNTEGVKLLNNEISNTKTGIYFKHANPAGNTNPGIEIAYNFVHDTGRDSMFLNSNYAYVHDNVIGANAPSFHVTESNGGVGGNYNVIEHNTFSSAVTIAWETNTTYGIGNTLKDNVFCKTTYIHDYSTVPSQTISDYNLYPAGTAVREYRITYTLAQWQALYPTMDDNSLAGAPIFVGGSAPTALADFELAANSPGKFAASDGTDMGADISKVGVIPEPATMVLLAMGSLAILKRKRIV